MSVWNAAVWDVRPYGSVACHCKVWSATAHNIHNPFGGPKAQLGPMLLYT